jgi:ketosteroid isomerase-like protein
MIDIMHGTEQIAGSDEKSIPAGLKATLLVILVAALAAGGWYWVKTHQKPAVTVDPAVSVAEVKAADTAWSQAAKANDVNAVLGYYADDAFVMPPNQEMATDKPAIRKAWEGLLAKGSQVEWTPGAAESAASGELVYVEGFYMARTAQGKGKSSLDRGKYLSVWRKQPDGKWKAIANMWNSDLPAKR